jgi:transposase
MPRSKAPIVSLEEARVRFEEWRSNRRGKARIPAELWSVAVEVARKEGINRTARELHVAWNDLKRRMPAAGAVPRQPAFVELVTPQMQSVPECTLEVEGRRGKLRIQAEGCFGFISGDAEPGVGGVGVLIQITPQLRILVAVDAIDGRKGIDSLAQLCREKLAADPFSGCLFIFRSRRGTAIKLLAYDGQGFWLATKRLSKGRFKWWPSGSEPARTLRAHQAQLLLAAANPDAEAPPVWRQVSA